jgi:hypothetical protein
MLGFYAMDLKEALEIVRGVTCCVYSMYGVRIQVAHLRINWFNNSRSTHNL